MAFTFQINNDIKFNHDEKLLAKAAANEPKLKHTTVKATDLVDIVADEQAFNGYKAVANNQDIKQLPTYALKKGGKLVLDFGDHQVGRFSIDIDSVGSPMDAPLYLHLTFAETPAEIGVDASGYDGWLSSSWITEEYIHLDVLPTKLSLPRRYAFRYVEIEVKDTSPKWQASFSNPQVVTESAVSMTDVPLVNIDDPELKRIDEVSIKTLHDCMQSVFEDGPKRDHRLWLGDLRLQALANYATFNDDQLVKRCLYLFGGMTTTEGKISANVFTTPKVTPDDTFMYDYSLFFISVLSDFYKQSQNNEVLNDLYPIAKKQIELALKAVGNDDLLVMDEDWPVFVDWSTKIDKATAGQAILIYVLKQFIGLVQQKEPDQVARYQALVDRYSAAAVSQLFDADQGLFVSGPNREVNIASQVWMVLAHVLDDAENEQLMTKAVAKLFPVTGIATPYMYHHIAAALFEANHQADAIKLIKSYWGKMIDLGADTFFEAFEPENLSFSPYGSPVINSYCHAWSCTPTYLIRKYLVK
ncbi:family 78 glycoside hydrolase catalytic domain [Lactiplantibacillus fabifermentans]|uniref:Bacterial alpha-L-rhamnosidase n=2 Tax=Lactiplantibacillus fabifermentans TaxID=483011 RepID=A0A0R2NNN5_9LACO|nr:family 78 glycoside hydrolase catalytic domain [Lactiplantibacillus fabifermentans]ETY72927.1 alpha-rhamnosidase [Lactiplantibacillus fabifermentans T30PCM01]KRO27303.1 bacterial alpha-L-rhamnosidase [Lactiplantibacillus fabifermentans DSM 21115]